MGSGNPVNCDSLKFHIKHYYKIRSKEYSSDSDAVAMGPFVLVMVQPLILNDIYKGRDLHRL